MLSTDCNCCYFRHSSDLHAIGGNELLLRRITNHVKDQNWFAVGIDFFIVVIGVFIGIQVANWNELRQDVLSEALYLERFADEIGLTIAHLEEERAYATDALSKIETFTHLLYADDETNEALIQATRTFHSDGAFFVNFWPNRTTFDNLVSTGNIDTIKDTDIRAGLVRLHKGAVMCGRPR